MTPDELMRQAHLQDDVERLERQRLRLRGAATRTVMLLETLDDIHYDQQTVIDHCLTDLRDILAETGP